MHSPAVFRPFLLASLVLLGLSSTGLARDTKSTVATKARKEAPLEKGVSTNCTLKVDQKNSWLKWVGSKITGASHNGTVALKSGTIEVSADSIKSGVFEIDMASISNEDLKAKPKDSAKLVGHLKSEDFFSVEKHPTATFKITSVKPLANAAAGQPTHEIAGDLTIKGKANPVSFPATISLKNEKAEATANFAIDRTKWDVRYGSKKFFDNLGDKVIHDDIRLELKLNAVKL